ncbi:hypothetical protein CCM_05454 [Cordyceps militaris CM01]|uniref:Secreted protein n=1 Tax=Cordyceps militaris (strain CM01) TaxID=983644 RepID=G3JJQ6_CORMM|nr:uncharacterized protein CCM_05454 [Cordyceps militaris CM01]EGX91296.1 hypothetical protein CCM_05454 [Cordyceps militaris CM01]
MAAQLLQLLLFHAQLSTTSANLTPNYMSTDATWLTIASMASPLLERLLLAHPPVRAHPDRGHLQAVSTLTGPPPWALHARQQASALKVKSVAVISQRLLAISLRCVTNFQVTVVRQDSLACSAPSL